MYVALYWGDKHDFGMKNNTAGQWNVYNYNTDGLVKARGVLSKFCINGCPAECQCTSDDEEDELDDDAVDGTDDHAVLTAQQGLYMSL